MNILKMEYLLMKKAWQEKKAARVQRHSTKAFYRKLDEAIEMCKQHPRKYFIVKKSEAEWEILGSQEIRKMRKFKEAKHDESFMTLHETAPYVSPENLRRIIHEQKRRKNRWWFLFTENYYKQVTKEEIELLKQCSHTLAHSGSPLAASDLDKFIQKHKG